MLYLTYLLAPTASRTKSRSVEAFEGIMPFPYISLHDHGCHDYCLPLAAAGRVDRGHSV